MSRQKTSKTIKNFYLTYYAVDSRRSSPIFIMEKKGAGDAGTPHECTIEETLESHAEPRQKAFCFWTGRKALEPKETPFRLLTQLTPGDKFTELKCRVIRAGPLCIATTSGVKFFTFRLVDSSGSMDGICFGNTADNLFLRLKIDTVHQVLRGTVRVSNIDPAKLEIVLNKSDWISPSPVDLDTPLLSFDPLLIVEILMASVNSVHDVIGIIVKIDPLTSGVSGNGKPFKRRTVYLTDDSTDANLPVTVWGMGAEYYDFHLYEPVAILQGNLASYREEKSISCDWNTGIWMNPNSEKAMNLYKWFTDRCDAEGISIMEA